jgi:hypothetical protein
MNRKRPRTLYLSFPLRKRQWLFHNLSTPQNSAVAKPQDKDLSLPPMRWQRSKMKDLIANVVLKRDQKTLGASQAEAD